MGWLDQVVGATILRRPAIQSPGYTKGSTGWSINQDGTAEFNSLTLRGTFNGTDYIINASGIFLYNGVPAAGNLLISIAPAAGTDSFGNAYPAGFNLNAGGSVSTWVRMDSSLATPEILFQPNASKYTGATGPGFVDATDINLGGGQPQLVISSPRAPGRTPAQITLDGTTVDGTTAGNITLDTGGTSTNSTVNVVQPLVLDAASWTLPTLGTGWATNGSGGGLVTCRYRQDAEDNLIIQGAVHSTSATPAATIFTSTFAPKATWRGPGAVQNRAGTVTVCELAVDTSGNVSVVPNLSATSNDVYFMAVVPLGNIA